MTKPAPINIDVTPDLVRASKVRVFKLTTGENVIAIFNIFMDEENKKPVDYTLTYPFALTVGDVAGEGKVNIGFEPWFPIAADRICSINMDHVLCVSYSEAGIFEKYVNLMMQQGLEPEQFGINLDENGQPIIPKEAEVVDSSEITT